MAMPLRPDQQPCYVPMLFERVFPSSALFHHSSALEMIRPISGLFHYTAGFSERYSYRGRMSFSNTSSRLGRAALVSFSISGRTSVLFASTERAPSLRMVGLRASPTGPARLRKQARPARSLAIRPARGGFQSARQFSPRTLPAVSQPRDARSPIATEVSCGAPDAPSVPAAHCSRDI